MSKLVLYNALVIDGINDEPMENGYVRIENGRITDVGQGRPQADDGAEFDLKGKSVLPGLIDSHVHLVWDGTPDPVKRILGKPETRVSLWAYRNALNTLDHGITTVRDLGSPGRTILDLAEVIRDGSLVGPNIVASGPALVMTGGHIHYISCEVDGVDNVRAAARKVMKDGAALVKVMASGGIYTEGEQPGSPQLTVEELRAAVSEAHDREKKVSAHAEGLLGIRRALEAGVDTIEHGIFADGEALRRMKENGATLVPTMAVMRRLATDPRIPSFAQEKALLVTGPHTEMLREAVKLGVQIATGTDAGSPCSPPDVYFQELEIMQEVGMTPMEVIKSSTSIAANTVGRADLGALEPGRKADILVVNGNPLDELSHLRQTCAVLVGGEFYLNDI